MAYAKSFCWRLEGSKRYSQQITRFYSPLGPVGARSPMEISLNLPSRRYVGSIGGPTPGQIELQGEDAEEYTQIGPRKTRSSWSPTLFKMFESAATTFASIIVLGLAGYGYHRVCRLLEQDLPFLDYPSTYFTIQVLALEKGC